MKNEKKDEQENLLQGSQQPQQVSKEEMMKIIGKNLTYFLNMSGVMPARAKETLEAHQAWGTCCDFAMSLESGDTVCISAAVAGAMNAAQQAEVVDKKKDKDKKDKGQRGK